MTEGPLFLLADIGGTNTRVALSQGAVLQRQTIQRFRNAEHDGIVSILSAYLAQAGSPEPVAVGVDLAGPVKDNVGQLTNLDWVVDGAEIAALTGAATVSIQNDMQAMGHSVGHLGPEALTTLRAGSPAAGPAARMVVNVGTGFNAALVLEGPQGTIVPASESGHVTLPQRNADDARLAAWLAERHGFPSVEEALSGRGLGQVHGWLLSEGHPGAPLDSAGIFATWDAEPTSYKALETFVRLLGNATGDLALVHLPFGGIYMVGGMARAAAQHAERMGFEAAFRDKGRFSDYLAAFPVHVVEDDYAALVGMAAHVSQLVLL
ncbi:glucokinase [Mesobacterium pallidum]|uniref:glucokinase n=1 Tax=Mesobacterium pallidum TaxID=2872037 RepID=UPI001EE24729|nr:glucokinase [Mesobacterium pallidum]